MKKKVIIRNQKKKKNRKSKKEKKKQKKKSKRERRRYMWERDRKFFVLRKFFVRLLGRKSQSNFHPSPQYHLCFAKFPRWKQFDKNPAHRSEKASPENSIWKFVDCFLKFGWKRGYRSGVPVAPAEIPIRLWQIWSSHRFKGQIHHLRLRRSADQTKSSTIFSAKILNQSEGQIHTGWAPFLDEGSKFSGEDNRPSFGSIAAHRGTNHGQGRFGFACGLFEQDSGNKKKEQERGGEEIEERSEQSPGSISLSMSLGEGLDLRNPRLAKEKRPEDLLSSS